ncbi:MAG: sensor histidine kinase [Anaerolinea sp.]|nr:sensor histidine kinase [Anaerolinea sp.]
MAQIGGKLGDAWARWSGAWQALMLILCALALVVALFDPETPALAPPIGLTALLIGWHYAARWLPAFSLPEYAGYFALGWLIWYGLAGYNPVFFMLLAGLFPHVFMIVPLRYAIGFALILNVLVLLQLQRINSDLTATWMGILVVTSLGGALLGYYITDIIGQSSERKKLIEQLEAAQSQIAEMQRQAGIAGERQRLAGELHDTIAQGLIAIVTHLEAADAAPADARRYLDGAKALARDNLREVRRFIWELRPPALEGRRLEEGLRGVVASWSRLSGTAAELVITGEALILPDAVELVLLRVTQEALANVSKHAHARCVTVTLSYMPDTVILDVNDDGVGFLPEHAHDGYGLINMRARVTALGGTLTVESAPNEGTTIVTAVPLRET